MRKKVQYNSECKYLVPQRSAFVFAQKTYTRQTNLELFENICRVFSVFIVRNSLTFLFSEAFLYSLLVGFSFWLISFEFTLYVDLTLSVGTITKINTNNEKYWDLFHEILYFEVCYSLRHVFLCNIWKFILTEKKTWCQVNSNKQLHILCSGCWWIEK